MNRGFCQTRTSAFSISAFQIFACLPLPTAPLELSGAASQEVASRICPPWHAVAWAKAAVLRPRQFSNSYFDSLSPERSPATLAGPDGPCRSPPGGSIDSLSPARSPSGLRRCRSAPAGSILLPTFYFLLSTSSSCLFPCPWRHAWPDSLRCSPRPGAGPRCSQPHPARAPATS